MKAVLISIQPKWCEKIANKEKTIEVRKTKPSIQTPFKCYIYCTIGNGIKGDYLIPSNLQCGKVISEFVCDRIYEWTYNYNVGEYNIGGDSLCRTCLLYSEFENYGKGKTLYGWHISDLVIYDKPKELSEFSRSCSYSGLCFSCKRASFKKDGNLLCDTEITRAPQSWCYVEELQGERNENIR